MILAVDFDGTCVLTTRFPDKYYNIGAGPVLRLLQRKHKLFLWTLRGFTNVDWMGNNYPIRTIDYAIKWAKDTGVEFCSYNKSPEYMDWSDSGKQHADLFIDDMALGAPLYHCDIKGVHYRFIDWEKVVYTLIGSRILRCTAQEMYDAVRQIVKERKETINKLSE